MSTLENRIMRRQVEVKIDGIWYQVYPETMRVTTSGKFMYGTIEGRNVLFDEPVMLEYVRVNGSKAELEKPYKIIPIEQEE